MRKSDVGAVVAPVVAPVALTVLSAFFIATACAAVDYGDRHWDEASNVRNLAYAFAHHAPFPQYYDYGTTLLWPLAVAAAPEVAAHGLDDAPPALMQKPYRLRARALLIVLAALTIALTFALSRALRRPPVEALLAAALVATSWQLSFHARFIANDALLTVFATAALALCAAARHRIDHGGLRGRVGFLAAGAVCAGFATGCKYTAGLLLVPLIVEALRLKPRARPVTWVGVAYAVGFALSTPGALFEPGLIAKALRFYADVYGGGWLGYTVSGPLDALRAMFSFLALSSLSPFRVVALGLFACAVGGAVVVARAERSPVWLYPVALVAVIATQHAFLARNLVALLPLVAVLAVRGAVSAYALVSARVASNAVGARSVVVVAVVVGAAVVVANGAYAIYAAGTIRDAATDRWAHDAAAYVDAHPSERVLVSPALSVAIGAKPNVVASPDAADVVIARPEELFVEWEWPANDPFLIERVFGPKEIDFAWAPTWRGPPRALLLDVARARAAGAALDFQPKPQGPPPKLPEQMLSR